MHQLCTPMAKGPGVSATSRINAQSQTNIHYYSDLPKRLQHIFIHYFIFSIIEAGIR
jgi:hypothetical protein